MLKNYTTISQKHKENCEDSKIERTSSQLENMFLKIMPKHIKRKMKTFKMSKKHEQN